MLNARKFNPETIAEGGSAVNRVDTALCASTEVDSEQYIGPMDGLFTSGIPRSHTPLTIQIHTNSVLILRLLRMVLQQIIQITQTMYSFQFTRTMQMVYQLLDPMASKI